MKKSILFLLMISLFSFEINAQCSSTITSFPHNEGFETTPSWTPTTTAISTSCAANPDVWIKKSAGTGSSNTGPTAAQEGTFYIYTEASGSCSNDLYTIESPCYDLSGKTTASVSFYYHMYGATIGSLQLLVSTNNGSTYSSLWSLSGDQGNSWTQISVNLDAYAGQTIKLKFDGTTGTSYTSDMAVDNITVDAAGGGGGGSSLWVQSGSSIYYNTGNVGIGITNPDYKLTVNGNVRAREYKATLSNWPDYVFESNYDLMPIEALADFIAEKKHLPKIPSEAQMIENGLNLVQMNVQLTEKIEELTLYIIQLNQKINDLQTQVEAQNNIPSPSNK